MNSRGVTYDRERIETLKHKLMVCLENKDSKALRILAHLKRIGAYAKDEALLGYVYYRYAYYYYFTHPDKHRFRQNLQTAIGHLLRAGDNEFLAGAYNLVSYEALDLGRYDTAYAYSMLALRTSEQVSGISLPGLVKANTGRLLVELGLLKEGRTHLRGAIRSLRGFPDMYLHHYNMIVTYADEALASFLLGDARGSEAIRRAIGEHFAQSDKAEQELSAVYRFLTDVYAAMLVRDNRQLSQSLKKLCDYHLSMGKGELPGLIFETETICNGLMDRNDLKRAKELLDATADLGEDENATVALRYHMLYTRFCELSGDGKRLRESLLRQHVLYKKHLAEHIRERKYEQEFVEMIQSIAADRNRVRREHDLLEYRTYTDALTELPNRSAMDRVLAEKLDGARFEGCSFAIGIIDVDRFKAYNDTYGHPAGDDCLRNIGRILTDYAEKHRLFCARYGGDEFIVCYMGYSDAEIRRIARAMHKEIPITVSQGICNAVPTAGRKLWDYFSAADRALYQIKKRADSTAHIKMTSI